MAAASVKGTASQSAATVDVGKSDEIDIGGYNHVEGPKEGRVLLFGDIADDDVDLDARIQLLDFWGCRLGALDAVSVY